MMYWTVLERISSTTVVSVLIPSNTEPLPRFTAFYTFSNKKNLVLIRTFNGYIYNIFPYQFTSIVNITHLDTPTLLVDVNYIN